jgi:hypothetical protein
MEVARWHIIWIENAYQSTRSVQKHLRIAAVMLWERVYQAWDRERHAETGGKILAVSGNG